jgi:hypothetical protein
MRHCSRELTTAPVPLFFNKSSSLFNDLNLERFRHEGFLDVAPDIKLPAPFLGVNFRHRTLA